jgi:hypothetical protein
VFDTSVRRVKKPMTKAQPGDQVEIITRPDGTKVRRIRRAKKPEDSSSSLAENGVSLESHLGISVSSRQGSSATVAGDMADGEIYIRADGKKYVFELLFRSSVLLLFSANFCILILPQGSKST